MKEKTVHNSTPAPLEAGRKESNHTDHSALKQKLSPEVSHDHRRSNSTELITFVK